MQPLQPPTPADFTLHTLACTFPRSPKMVLYFRGEPPASWNPRWNGDFPPSTLSTAFMVELWGVSPFLLKCIRAATSLEMLACRNLGDGELWEALRGLTRLHGLRLTHPRGFVPQPRVPLPSVHSISLTCGTHMAAMNDWTWLQYFPGLSRFSEFFSSFPDSVVFPPSHVRWDLCYMENYPDGNKCTAWAMAPYITMASTGLQEVPLPSLRRWVSYVPLPPLLPHVPDSLSIIPSRESEWTDDIFLCLLKAMGNLRYIEVFCSITMDMWKTRLLNAIRTGVMDHVVCVALRAYVPVEYIWLRGDTAFRPVRAKHRDMYKFAMRVIDTHEEQLFLGLLHMGEGEWVDWIE